MSETPAQGDGRTWALPRRLGPRRRWWYLALWVGLLLAAHCAQWTAGYWINAEWIPDWLAPTLRSGWLWLLLPPATAAVLAVVFLVGLRRWVPEKGTRNILLAWGAFFSVLSLAAGFAWLLWMWFVALVGSLD